MRSKIALLLSCLTLLSAAVPAAAQHHRHFAPPQFVPRVYVVPQQRVVPQYNGGYYWESYSFRQDSYVPPFCYVTETGAFIHWGPCDGSE